MTEAIYPEVNEFLASAQQRIAELGVDSARMVKNNKREKANHNKVVESMMELWMFVTLFYETRWVFYDDDDKTVHSLSEWTDEEILFWIDKLTKEYDLKVTTIPHHLSYIKPDKLIHQIIGSSGVGSGSLPTGTPGYYLVAGSDGNPVYVSPISRIFYTFNDVV